MQYQRIVLASRPIGAPRQKNFRLESAQTPSLKANDVLVKTIYLSLDPYMRGRMSDAKSYADPVPLNGPMIGATVGVVAESNNGKFEVGDWVLGFGGWQEYSISQGKELIGLGKSPENPSYALGVLGMPGFTAYHGLLNIAKPKPSETLVVAAATGPVGATVGQIAKLKGCQVVGIAGGEQKCDYAKRVLGFDDCLNHNEADLPQQLKAACPKGIDIYFENVGGEVFDAVLPLLNDFSRVPVCGLVAHYNATDLPVGQDRLSMLMATILVKRIHMQGFIIFDEYDEHFEQFSKDMNAWIDQDKVQYKEQIVEGLGQAPQAFMGLLEGKNFGKLTVKVGEP